MSTPAAARASQRVASLGAAETLSGPSYSPTAQVARRLARHNGARLGALIILFFTLVALLAPVVRPYDATTDLNLPRKLEAPSADHWLGTDNLGRDVLVRLAHGAPVSMRVGLFSVSLALVAGTMLGLISGLAGGLTDNLIMRLMDIMLAFPALLLAIAIVAVRGPGLDNTLLAVGVVNIPTYARLARSMALSLRDQDFIVASRSLGANTWRVLFVHLLPNSLSPLIVQATLGIGGAILYAAALGFLGLGQQPPFPEWGVMLSDSYRFLTVGAWWVLLFPGLAIMFTVLGFNLLGDGLRDALDPRLSNVGIKIKAP
jgi:peptide/nickel transport system permease protein